MISGYRESSGFAQRIALEISYASEFRAHNYSHRSSSAHLYLTDPSTQRRVGSLGVYYLHEFIRYVLISKFGLPSLAQPLIALLIRGNPDADLGVPGSLSRLDYPVYFDGGLYIAWLACPFLCI